MTSNTESAMVHNERDFHDRWAATIATETIDVDACFHGSTSPENRFILERVGAVTGKFILDLGCGAGENSVYFARRGARCVAADVSPGMVATAEKLAREYRVAITGHVIDAQHIDFPDNTFDMVYAANLLHHVDPHRTLREMHRVLKPGGKACFWDPLKHNPLINIYRRMATQVRTADEHPLDYALLDDIRRLFATVEHDTFWLASLWIFLRFYLIERVDPNRERYWKKVITDEPRLRRDYYRLEKIDRLLKQFPWCKRFAWNLAVVATK